MVIAYVGAAFGLGAIPVNRDFRDAPEDGAVEVFVVSNGIHVDFLVPAITPVEDWTTLVPRRDFRGVDDTYSGLLLGWGSRAFYLETPTWADLKVSTVVRAVFWPGPSVVHAEYVDWRPVPGPTVRRVLLGARAYRALCDFIERSLRKDAAGTAILVPGKGYGPADNFYEAAGHYDALDTCNVWTNRGLKMAGVRTGLWAPFPQGVLWHLPDGS